MNARYRELFDEAAVMEPDEFRSFTAQAEATDHAMWARANIRPQPSRPLWPYAVAGIIGAALVVSVAAALVLAVEAATAAQIAAGAVEW